MTRKQEPTIDYVELRNGSKLYLLPLNPMSFHAIVADAEKEFEPRKIEQPWYWTVEPDADGKGGEKVLWTKPDVLKDGSPEEKEAWRAFEQNQIQQNQFIEAEMLKYILIEGTSKLVSRGGNEIDLIIDPVTFEWDPPPAWKARLNGNIPDDPYELKYLYLSPMVGDVEIQRQIGACCNVLTYKGAVTEEGLIRIASFLQGRMAQVGEEFDKIFAEFEAGDEGQAVLDVLASDAGTTDGQGVHASTVPVGRTVKKRPRRDASSEVD